MKRISYAPEVLEDLTDLIEILIKENYLYTYEDAADYVQDILKHFRENVEFYPCKTAPAYFERYGAGLRYLPYKRNQRTTWYIIFIEYSEGYHVVKITNNHVAAQFF